MPEHTIAQNLQRLQDAKTAISNAITIKGGTVNVGDGFEEFSTAIGTIPVRGYNHGGVNFFDIDGSVLYSYTKAEFLALTEMPPNPDRSWDWLTAQGWNWTLADAKAYVTTHGTLNIGQHYITIDDKTAIHVVLDEGCLNPQLGLYINGTVVVEWGDGTSDTLTGNGTGTYKYTDHTYAAPGRYYILLTVTGSAVIKTKQKLLCKGGLGTADPGNESKKYINSIQDIHLGANIDIGSYAFYRCYSMKHISIPVGVSSIGSGTFQYCTSLKGVVIPNGTTSLGISTFEGCYGLNFVSLPKTITSAGTKCFSQCYSLVALTCPESMASIGTYGFGDTASCAILTIPGMTGELPQEFLARNRSLTDLVIPEGVTSLGLNAMDFCYGIKNVTLPSTLKSVAAYAFSNCGALTEITFPDTFETFGDHTFYKDTALQHFTFPSSVTAIPASMFEACHSLSHIVIPATITSIAAKAFAEGYGLSYIKFGGSTPPTVAASNAFSGLPTDCIMYVPAEYMPQYKAASNYPDHNTYTYICYGTYTSGDTLPTTTHDAGYNLTWYATLTDWQNETNPITVSTGAEAYARATLIPVSATVTREVDFVNNTTTLDGDVNTLNVYSNMKRCNVADDGTINAYDGDLTYTEDGSNGQVMVKVNKFYYKLDVSQTGDLDGVHIRKGKWSISDTLDDGFKLHPAFLAADGVTELDYFLYGAFDAVGQDSNGTYSTSYNTTTYKLGSVGGNAYTPTNSFTRATARTMATNRGAGWYQAGVKQTMALQMLFAVEYGFNSQLSVGYGIVGASAASKTGITIGSTTSGTKDNQTTPVNWRGIENLWGNIWNWIDGLNINNRVPYVCDTFTFVDDTSTGYTQIGFSIPSQNAYVSALGYDANNDWIMLPSEATGANENSAIGDYVYSNTGWRVACLGGYWADAFKVGLFDWILGDDSSNANSRRGSRLMYVPQVA